MKPDDLIANGLIGASDLEWALSSQEVANLVSLGRYELLEELGRGGTAIVYRARDPLLNRDLALKRLRFGDPDLEARFLREAGLLARLSHPGILPVFDFGRENESLYYTMPLVSGLPMDRWIAERRPDPREAARVVREAAEALAYAHEHGVLHRDVKPANILLSSEGRAQVADFGLGRAEEADPREAGRRTESGVVMGTPSYMAPELAGGDLKRVDARCDIYSLGAALYEGLTYRPPFVGETSMDILMKVLGQEPVAPRKLAPAVPGDLEVICLKALEKDPGRRYATAREFADDLGRFLAGEPIRARRAGPLYRLRRQVGRRKALFAVALAGVIAAAGVVIYAVAREHGAAALRARVSNNLEAARGHIRAMERLLVEKPEKDPDVEAQAALAHDLIASALKDDPQNAEGWFLKGRIHALKYEKEPARRCYEAAIMNGPHAQAHLERAILDCQDLIDLLAGLISLGDPRRVDELRGRIEMDLEKAKTLTSHPADADFASALLEVSKGTREASRRAAEILKGFTTWKEEWRAVYWKGIAELQSGQLAEAENSFEKALESRKTGRFSARILELQGMLLHKRRRVEDSIRKFREAVDRDPEFARARLHLAVQLLFARSDPEETIRQVEKALELERERPRPEAHAVRGMAYVKKHRRDRSAAGVQALLEAKKSLEAALPSFAADTEQAEVLRAELDYVKGELAKPRDY